MVIAGAGPAFCAGHDLREIRSTPDRAAYEAVFALCSRLMQRIVRLPEAGDRPGHGVATAAGCQLVASRRPRDRRRHRALRHARGEYRTVLLHPDGSAEPGVGRKAAMEMLLTGEMIPAARATRDRACQPRGPRRPTWIPRSLAPCAAQIAEKSPLTVGHRQGGLLPAGRNGPRGRLQLRRRR